MKLSDFGVSIMVAGSGEDFDADVEELNRQDGTISFQPPEFFQKPSSKENTKISRIERICRLK